MHNLSMILQLHCADQNNVAPWVGTRDRLTVRMVTEMLAVEVLLEVAATGERLQRFEAGSSSLPRQKMHWVALHSTLRIFKRFRGGELEGEVCSSFTLISALRRRKP